uniref:hypothetical protein n=1 Tax=Ornithobacterium rhinotracheale TaxID=28251 RepID=UPI00129C46C0|nr:hypothetical protein [Ornithobacterium rhinotracheale]
MKLYDLCIIKENVSIYRKGAFAIILEMDTGDDYHLEIWDFDIFDGADLNFINKKYLRKVTQEEEKEYIQKFEKYTNKNE